METKMESLILTRYLYNLTDVKISFITSLLKSEDMKEVLFWASELYYSGYENMLNNLIIVSLSDNNLLHRKIQKNRQ